MIYIEIREVSDFILSFILLALFAREVGKKYGLAIGLTTFYFFGAGIMVFMNPIPFYNLVFKNAAQEFVKLHVPISFVAAQAYTLGFLITLMVAFAKRWQVETTFKVLKYFSVINAMYAVLAPAPWKGGVFWGNTFDATFATFFVPYFIQGAKNKNRLDILCLILTITAAICVGSITPFIILGAITVGYLIKDIKMKLLAIVGSGVLSVGALFFYIRHSPLHLTDRLYVWEKITKLFFEKFDILTGIGTGTYRVIGPILQGDLENIFYFLHNEPLQILIEDGIIGLALALWVYFVAWKNAKSRELSASFFGLALASLAHYPLRVGISFMFVLILIRMSWEEQHE